MKSNLKSTETIFHRIITNEKNFQADKSIELISMMSDWKFTQKAMKFSDLDFLKKETYLKNLDCLVQVQKKENERTKVPIKKIEKGENFE